MRYIRCQLTVDENNPFRRYDMQTMFQPTIEKTCSLIENTLGAIKKPERMPKVRFLYELYIRNELIVG